MRSFLEDTHGNIGSVWIHVLIILFSVITVYLLLYDVICVSLYNLAIDMAPENTAGEYFNILVLIRMVFNIFVWMIIFGALIWGFLSAQKREYETGY